MAVFIGGQHNVVFFGPRSNPKCVRWWADHGLIHVEDSRDNTHDTLGVREFLHRLSAINDMVGNSKAELASSGFAHKDEIDRQQKFIEEALGLVRLAKEQGEPGDKDTVKSAIARRPVTVIMPDKRMF
jgi:hypothetical protein|tara:strand:+ start:3810 stop:4193 length:384 start_codon:yes stop_codon:yes gene_type:complete